MGTLQEVFKERTAYQGYEGGIPEVSEDGRAIPEEEYWNTYYNHVGDVVYEWSNGRLEERPVADVKGSEIYQWHCGILRCYLQTYPIGRIINLEIGFRLPLPGKTRNRGDEFTSCCTICRICHSIRSGLKLLGCNPRA